jgi:hypothetical protein
MIDVAHAYRRYQFLGDEFLTWLWYVIDNRFDRLQSLDPDLVSLHIGNRMVLQNRKPNEGIETITIKGDHADLDEAVLAVKKGAMVAEIHLIYATGDHEWTFTLKGESLNISNLKTPESTPRESADEMEGTVIDRLYFIERITRLVHGLFQRFIRIRITDNWQQTELPAIRKWIIAH